MHPLLRYWQHVFQPQRQCLQDRLRYAPRINSRLCSILCKSLYRLYVGGKTLVQNQNVFDFTHASRPTNRLIVWFCF